MISALAAAVGLIFSGIVTALGVQAAQDQRQQQAADSARERRQQAAQVSYWWEYSNRGDADLVVNNRSLDPVYSLTIYFRYQSSWTTRLPGEGNPPHQPQKGSTVGYEFDVVPPCTRLDLTEVVMIKTWQLMFDYAPDDLSEVKIPAMTFQDASGASWKRRETGLDALRDATPGHSGIDFDEVGGGGLDGYRLNGGSTRPAEHCDQPA